MEISDQVKNLRDAMRNNRLVIFVGSGVSENSKIPTWGTLIKKFAKLIKYDRCKTCKMKSKACSKDDCPLRYEFSTDEYLKIPQYFYNSDNSKNHTNYKRVIYETLSNNEFSNVIDEILFKMLPHHIITTNYDKLLEKSTNLNTKLYSVIRHNNDMLCQNGNRYIIKMHGDIDDLDNIVLKENDYLEYSQTHVLIETYIKALLIDHTFLFIGYSLNDYNLKLILSWINYFAKNSKLFEERPKNYIIQSSDFTLKPFEKRYFSENNIHIFNTKELPAEILNKNLNIGLSEHGLKLYSCLDYILDENNDFLADTFENVLYEKYQILSMYNRISIEDLYSVYPLKKTEFKGNLLLFYDKNDFEKLHSVIISNSEKAKYVKSVYLKSGVNFIQHYNEDPIEILVDTKPTFEDELFDLYKNNMYSELIQILDNSNDIFVRAYYFHICTPQQTRSSELMNEIMENGIKDNELIRIIFFKYNNILLNDLAYVDTKLDRAEFNSILNTIPQGLSIACKYILNIHNGLGENISRMKSLFEDHEKMYIRGQDSSFFGSDLGKIWDLQSIVYDYYFYCKRNYLMVDFYSNPKTYYEPYLKAILCTYSPSRNLKEEKFLGIGNELDVYSINDIDLDMFVKFTRPKKLSSWLKQYKVNNLVYDKNIDISEKFHNLCVSMCFSSNTYIVGFFHSFSLLLTRSKLNRNDILSILRSLTHVVEFYITSNTQFITLIIEPMIAIISNFESEKLDELRELLNLLISPKLLMESRNTGSEEYSELINLLSGYQDNLIKGKIELVLDSSSDIELIANIVIFRKYIDLRKWQPLLLEKLNKISCKQLFRLLIDKTLPYDDKILEQFINSINSEVDRRKLAPGVKSYPDQLISAIDECIILFLIGYPINIQRLAIYKEYSDCLEFLIDPNSFDYRKVDIKNYMWINFFRHDEFGKKFKDHKSDILNSSIEMLMSNDLLGLDQHKVIFGILLDHDELWEYGRKHG